MISKSSIKLVHSLGQKKYRVREGLFVAEGPKVVGELLKSAHAGESMKAVHEDVMLKAVHEDVKLNAGHADGRWTPVFKEPKLLFATADWMTEHAQDLKGFTGCEATEVTDDELRKISFLQHPQQVLAVFPIPDEQEPEEKDTRRATSDGLLSVNSLTYTIPLDDLSLALDGVQDPGNVGTIIRLADWFGITHVYCSHETADVWSPKVVQATMGSIARVRVSYVDLPRWMASLPTDFPTYGTLLDGHDIYSEPLSRHGLIVMGNEGNGISTEVRNLVKHHLLIPNYPPGRPSAESLNVAIATAITCAEFRRRSLTDK